MTQKSIHGLNAAVFMPRYRDGTVNVAALRTPLEFIMDKGIYSFALNGATGEFCLTTSKHLRTLLALVREVGCAQTQFLCGVGDPGLKAQQPAGSKVLGSVER